VKLGRYQVRPAAARDLNRIAELDRLAFGSLQLTAAHFGSWLAVFNQGFLVAENLRGELVACSMTIRLEPEQISHQFHPDTGAGFGTTHRPDGRVLYGVSLLSLSPGAAQTLCLAHKLLGEELAVAQWNAYARLPGLAAWLAEQCLDPTLEAANRYVRCHVDLVQLQYEQVGMFAIRALPQYLPEDEDSAGFATLMVTINPHVGKASEPI
jgi:hypothetical protein